MQDLTGNKKSVFTSLGASNHTNKEPNYEQKKFSRWVNHKAIFNTVQFSEYRQGYFSSVCP